MSTGNSGDSGLATGGYGSVFFRPRTRWAARPVWRAYRKGATSAQIRHVHPQHGDQHDSDPHVGNHARRSSGFKREDGDPRIPEEDRDYYLERIYRRFGNLIGLTISHRVRPNGPWRRPG